MKLIQDTSKPIGWSSPVIGWFSGGGTSAVACKLAIDFFGIENVRIIFIDTKNEHPDTYRFKSDCEKWYGKEIETISNPKYSCIQDVWILNCSLNVANGAICSTELKRAVRQQFQKDNNYCYQIFGFDTSEPKRAEAMTMNYEDASPLYLLLMKGYSKEACFRIIKNAGIRLPVPYELGLHNNNCFQTMCVQGGVGYWQWAEKNEPEKFDRMADMEHYLSFFRGKPVTMLKKQNKKSSELVFLKPYWRFPEVKDISMMKGRPPKPLNDCNGYCGVNDLLKRSPTEKEINYELTP